MKKLITLITLASATLFVSACDDDEVEIDICSDDLDCDDGFICEITGEDDGICVND